MSIVSFVPLERHPVRKIFAGFFPMREKKFPAPPVHTHPSHEKLIDGHVVIAPAGNATSIGHVPYWHGLGGLSDGEREFLHNMAIGKYGEQVTVVAPLADLVAPRRDPLSNGWTTYRLMQFMSDSPPQIRTQFRENMVGNESNDIRQRMKNVCGTVLWPASWYPIVFEKIPRPRDAQTSRLSAMIPNRLFGTLKPDFNATAPWIMKAATAMAPLTNEVLNRTDAVDGKICAVGFSQGVGIAAASATLVPGYCRRISHTVLMSASYIETSNAPKVQNIIPIDIILPKNDPVPDAIGFTRDRIIADLRRSFPGMARIWECDGTHKVEGAVATLAGQRTVEALRHSHHRPLWVGPSL